MEKMNSYFNRCLLGYLVMLLTMLAGCNNDEKIQEANLEGTWKVMELKTDNEALNIALTLFLSTSGVKLNEVKADFSADKQLTLTLPGEEISSIVAAYAYDKKQLALRFDAFPVPFNAFNIRVFNIF